ncbi:hypothetical protein F441_12464 [Phytophthora nicotianae CJ01A1]|uniref:Uncharacterized protein n=1 Tax=Phytophthora nicotianae CJ01A1 TaxID=1317063 RepID=W2WNI2_PHYNI|nr:hypothetical protein F441_12464 [Phytophthora nicotianae CJ01A1]
MNPGELENELVGVDFICDGDGTINSRDSLEDVLGIPRLNKTSRRLGRCGVVMVTAGVSKLAEGYSFITNVQLPINKPYL